MGFALGCIRLTRHDFMSMTPEEFNAVVWQWRRLEEARSRESWEQARLAGFLAVVPYCGKKVKLPRDLFPFVWEQRPTPAAIPEKPMDKETLAAYFTRLEKRYG